MSKKKRDYDLYVVHPRFGQGPLYTGVDVNEGEEVVSLHWLTPRIPGTAIPAKASNSMIALTHYYDVERKCRDCHRMFIFFAAEQRYWYETLRFPIESDCVRCYPCRKDQQRLTRAKNNYDRLYHQKERTVPQTLSMIEYCLELIEANHFSTNKCTWVRMMCRRISKQFEKNTGTQEEQQKLALLQERVTILEANTKP